MYEECVLCKMFKQCDGSHKETGPQAHTGSTRHFFGNCKMFFLRASHSLLCGLIFRACISLIMVLLSSSGSSARDKASGTGAFSTQAHTTKAGKLFIGTFLKN